MRPLERAKKSFDYACKQASKCRHEKYYASCYACPDLDHCEIQKRIENERVKMHENY